MGTLWFFKTTKEVETILKDARAKDDENLQRVLEEFRFVDPLLPINCRGIRHHQLRPNTDYKVLAVTECEVFLESQDLRTFRCVPPRSFLNLYRGEIKLRKVDGRLEWY